LSGVLYTKIPVLFCTDDTVCLGKPIGAGAQADVYEYDNRAIKLFKPGYPQANAYYEANLQAEAFKTGLPVPEIYGLAAIQNRTGIVMEYARGHTLGSRLLSNPALAADCLAQAADMQRNVHAVRGRAFPLLKDKLYRKINSAPLPDTQRQSLLRELDGLATDGALCHGDFHVLNLIETADGLRIIDWVDASIGCAAADVCRSYLLYLLYKQELAEIYLRCYCKKAGIPRENVIEWLPILAAARMTENNSPEDLRLLFRLSGCEEE